MLPQAAFSPGTRPMISTSTRLERYTSPKTDSAMARSRPCSGPRASTPMAATQAAMMSLWRSRA